MDAATRDNKKASSEALGKFMADQRDGYGQLSFRERSLLVLMWEHRDALDAEMLSTLDTLKAATYADVLELQECDHLIFYFRKILSGEKKRELTATLDKGIHSRNKVLIMDGGPQLIVLRGLPGSFEVEGDDPEKPPKDTVQ